MPKSIFSVEQGKLQELLKKSRIEAGMSQVELAKGLNRPQSFVSKYENGERRLDILELRAVCAVLKIGLPGFVRQLEQLLKHQERGKSIH